MLSRRLASELLHNVVVIKGETHIVDQDGRALLFQGGVIGLATSGSGNVLAGIITGLPARADPTLSALWGVYLHGEAGRPRASVRTR